MPGLGDGEPRERMSLDPSLVISPGSSSLGSMRFIAIDHVQLLMPSGAEENARAFFTGILGLPEVVKPAPLAVRGGCWFTAGTVSLHLSVDAHFQPQGKAHPAIIVDGLDELAATLARHRVAVEWDTALPDRRRFYAKDPFGNRIEFMADGCGFTQR